MLIFFQEIMFYIITNEIKINNKLFQILNYIFKPDGFGFDERYSLLNIIYMPKITFIFGLIFLVSIFIGLIITIFNIIKTIIYQNTDIIKIISKYIIAIITTLIITVLFVLIIYIVDELSVFIIKNININTNINMGDVIFDLCVEEWFNKYTIADVNINSIPIRNLLGDYTFVSYSIWPVDWMLNGMINPNNFSYIMGFICNSIILISLIYIIIHVIKRIFDIALLYILLPLVLVSNNSKDEKKKHYFKKFFSSVIIILFTCLIFYIFIIITNYLIVIEKISTSIIFDNKIFKLLIITSGVVSIAVNQKLLIKYFNKCDKYESNT